METPQPPESVQKAPAVSATVVCPECGDLIDIKHVESLLLSLHQQNACTATGVIVGGGRDD